MRSRLAASAVFALAVLALSGCGTKVEPHAEIGHTLRHPLDDLRIQERQQGRPALEQVDLGPKRRERRRVFAPDHPTAQDREGCREPVEATEY